MRASLALQPSLPGRSTTAQRVAPKKIETRKQATHSSCSGTKNNDSPSPSIPSEFSRPTPSRQSVNATFDLQNSSHNQS